MVANQLIIDAPLITGAILAGGRGSRMGGQDKGLVSLNGQPLYAYIAERLKPQVNRLVINANRHLDIYRQSNLPVITDLTPDFSGPLAGMQAVLAEITTDWVIFVPCDVPSFPKNLVQKMWEEKGDAIACYASDTHREHPTFTLLHRSVEPQLKQYLNNGDRKLMLFMQKVSAKCIVFPTETGAFANLNTPEDCANWQNNANL
ncbi:molybdenum cofactor guanylyltransferase MobA [Moellerella wisconsensis]|uniref:Molybdenum cofactor guanylyltransferase MobA n=1 Tax=Moellerella wisconsensis TaxID=158849 RepID=A0ACD3Y7P7_9GAMM|nr:molybdenum cofactor guanylyltransferase MobA [Moellerella wisconsensis]UNH24390.1 molybdenum cofactor guanylyltransferase MobA [Moellerella wisconsensis]UNH39113.1 molybdenum cofactor guanylyltransferase MobA [Moellerella wisconsensis]